MEQNLLQPVQLRSDLEFSRQQQQGKTYLIVKDPLTKRYFRFTESQAAILDFLKEPFDAETLSPRVSEKLGGSVPPAALAGFFKSLEDKLLLDTPDVREKIGSYKSRKLSDEEEGFLYWKLASLNPERVFAWLLPRTRWAYTAWFQVFALFSILSGFAITFLHWTELGSGIENLFNFQSLFLIWLVVFSVITAHEFAHGLTCCHFGGKVHEVGFMLIYFQPAFYCDVSDSWMFPSKRNRMLVTLAGGYFQLVVWGLCNIIWRVTTPDSFINQLALIVVLFSGIQTLFNFNPLIKLDGYYMLSDYLEIPNLRAKSSDALWKWVGGKHRSRRPWKEQRAQLIYGVSSFVFSTTLLVYVYSALYTWATAGWAFAGLVGFMAFSTITLRRTAMDSVAGVRAVLSRVAFKKYRNLGIFGALLLISFVGYWELKVPAEFRVIARSERTVRAETDGVVVEVLVREGSQVAKGDLLARQRDFEKQQRISELNGDLSRRRSELTLLRAGARAEELDRKQKLVETRRVELANARRNQEQRNQLQQVLERKRSELQLDEQELRRARELIANGLIARAELDKRETAVEVREREIAEIEASIRVITETADRQADLKARELAEAESELKLMQAGNRPEQIRQIEAEVSKLESQIEILNQELGRTEIRAPIDGVVATPFVERKANQFLEAGDELMRLVEISRVTVEMLVPEKELAEVRPGNVIWMKARSFPSLDIQGRVDFIAPVAQAVEGQQMVVVRSEVENGNLLLKPDMTGVAHIYCGERRIINLMTRRIVRWVRTEFWYLLP
jgi:multidrug efflux pump subunit AcrA (membrane-fusion protein)